MVVVHRHVDEFENIIYKTLKTDLATTLEAKNEGGGYPASARGLGQ
jgi:hypothetical protein